MQGGEAGDRRVGVIWHTQGSGKSLSMVFYAGQIVAAPGDGESDAGRADRPQRSGRPAFRHVLSAATNCCGRRRCRRRPASICASCSTSPAAAWSSPPSRSSCPRRRASKHPLLSDRRNIVVIADEAHRSQYDFIDGFARHMRDALPNASFIGFTGTPIEKTRREHAGGVRRLHRHLRHPARGGRQGHRADLLREPAGEA